MLYQHGSYYTHAHQKSALDARTVHSRVCILVVEKDTHTKGGDRVDTFNCIRGWGEKAPAPKPGNRFVSLVCATRGVLPHVHSEWNYPQFRLHLFYFAMDGLILRSREFLKKVFEESS